MQQQALLNPAAVTFTWVTMLTLIALASAKSFSTAWQETAPDRAEFDWSVGHLATARQRWSYLARCARLAVKFVYREQLAYVKLLPELLATALICCFVAYIVPA